MTNKILLVLIIVFASSCLIAKQNETDLEALWMKRMQSVTEALYWYYGRNHTYPVSLEQLVPDYLPEFPYPAEEKGNVKYTLLNDSYDLGFVILRPNYRECRISPSSGSASWRCYSYE
ncbi:MAG: hypothetical protein IT292_08910 [Deltaproteobacteria bacterium]|nr:hypothetical protein [Deltaproteobacteria bacterium]